MAMLTASRGSPVAMARDCILRTPHLIEIKAEIRGFLSLSLAQFLPFLSPNLEEQAGLAAGVSGLLKREGI